MKGVQDTLPHQANRLYRLVQPVNEVGELDSATTYRLYILEFHQVFRYDQLTVKYKILCLFGAAVTCLTRVWHVMYKWTRIQFSGSWTWKLFKWSVRTRSIYGVRICLEILTSQTVGIIRKDMQTKALSEFLTLKILNVIQNLGFFYGSNGDTRLKQKSNNLYL